MVIGSEQLAESGTKKPFMIECQFWKALYVFAWIPLHMRSIIACLNSGFWTERLRENIEETNILSAWVFEIFIGVYLSEQMQRNVKARFFLSDILI
jgi:hypothetical protein